MTSLVSIPEAADIIGVDRSTVWDWVKSGRLQPATYVGKRAAFDRQYIVRFGEQYRSRRKQAAA